MQWGSTETILPWEIFKKSRFSTRLHSYNVRRKAAIHTQRQLIAPSWQRGATVDSTDIQKISFLSCATNGTGLVPLISITSQQFALTEATMRKARQYLDFITSQEEAILTYSASDIILAPHSDASYLSKSNTRSRAGGHSFLSKNVSNPPNNGAILNIAQIIKNVIPSATEV